MSTLQDRLTLLSAVVVESVWIYSILATLSLLAVPGGSPISWVAALCVAAVSFMTARGLSLVIMPTWMPYVLQMAVGALTIYLVLGAQLQTAGQWMDLGWLSGVFSDTQPEHFTRKALLGGFFSTLFWLRGGRLASTEFPVEHLMFTFRLGLIALSVAAVVDIFHPADLKIFSLMFVFFVAGLIGLGVGHILPSAGQTLTRGRWARVIGAVVGCIALLGLLFSLLQRGALSFIAAPLIFLLNIAARIVFFVIIVPLVYILSFIISGVFWLMQRVAGDPPEGEQEFGLGGQEFLEQFVEQSEPSEPSIWLQILAGIAVALLVGAILLVLARAFRRKTRWLRVEEEGERESLEGEFDPTMDLARLLFGLLPDRFRRRRTQRRLQLPDDERNIVDVFRIYFGMLNIAESRGQPRLDFQTPGEYRTALRRVLPDRLVDMATAAFDRACYGRLPSTTEEIAEMRQMLEEAGREKRGDRR